MSYRKYTSKNYKDVIYVTDIEMQGNTMFCNDRPMQPAKGKSIYAFVMAIKGFELDYFYNSRPI